MISLVYARSLANGRGLTWGFNETPIEGFTNPLWTLLMTLGELAPVRDVWRPLGVQLAGLVILLFAVGQLASFIRYVRPGQTQVSARWTSAACFAVFPVWYWSLMGLEMSLLCLLSVVLVSTVVRAAERPDDPVRTMCIVGAACPLVRLDTLLPVVMCVGWLMLQKRARRPAMFLLGSSLLAAALYQIFRLTYFGAWLPNTYYLKMTGQPLEDRLARGVGLLLANRSAVMVLLLIVVALAGSLALKRRTPALLLAVCTSMFAYSVWVGGDAWDLEFAGISRFVASVLPMGIAGVLLGSGVDFRARWQRLAGALFALAVASLANGWIGERGLSRVARQVGLAEDPYLVSSHHLVFDETARLQRRFGGHDVLVTTCWAGIPAYFTDFRWVDCLGYTDPEIARLPVNGPADAMHLGVVAGHDKRYPEAVLRKNPDVIYQLDSYGDLSELLVARGYRKTSDVWWVRRGLLRRLKAK